MSDENNFEEKTTAEDAADNKDPKTGTGSTGSGKTTDPSLKSAWKQVENIGQALGDALQGRGNVVMVRINDESLRYLDMLVEAEVAKSRSEAAALLINEGVNANQELFQQIGKVTEQIEALREHLRKTVKNQNLNSE
jgi:hypothetical protein